MAGATHSHASGVELGDEEHIGARPRHPRVEAAFPESSRHDGIDGEEMTPGINAQSVQRPSSLARRGQTGRADQDQRHRDVARRDREPSETGCAVPGQWASAKNSTTLPARRS